MSLLEHRLNLKILLRVLLSRHAKVVLVEDILILVRDEQRGVTGITVQCDVVSREAVAQAVFRRGLLGDLVFSGHGCCHQEAGTDEGLFSAFRDLPWRELERGCGGELEPEPEVFGQAFDVIAAAFFRLLGWSEDGPFVEFDLAM